MTTDDLYKRLESIVDLLKADKDWELRAFDTALSGNTYRVYATIYLEDVSKKHYRSNSINISFEFPVEEMMKPRMVDLVRKFTYLLPKREEITQ